MAGARDFSRYSLYGEENAAIAPEFVHIEPISARSSRYEWTIAPHSHPGIFQLLLLERGTGTLTADGAAVALAPTALVSVPSGAIHAFDFAVGAEGWMLSIASDLLGELNPGTRPTRRDMQGGPAAAVVLAGEHRLATRLSRLFGDLAADLAGARAGALSETTLAGLALVLALAGETLAPATATAPPPAGTEARREQLVRRFRDLVDRHFREGWPVTRYAAALGTSPPTLTRACREALGRAPGAMVLDRVLLEAMRALTYTGTGIGRIAEDLGFADPAYFARFFRARAGMAPSRFRAEHAWLGPPRGGAG